MIQWNWNWSVLELTKMIRFLVWGIPKLYELTTVCTHFTWSFTLLLVPPRRLMFDSGKSCHTTNEREDSRFRLRILTISRQQQRISTEFLNHHIVWLCVITNRESLFDTYYWICCAEHLPYLLRAHTSHSTQPALPRFYSTHTHTHTPRGRASTITRNFKIPLLKTPTFPAPSLAEFI